MSTHSVTVLGTTGISHAGKFGRPHHELLLDTTRPEVFKEGMRALVDAQRRTWAGGFSDLNHRKILAWQRRQIWEEDFAPLVAQKIQETHHDPGIKNRITKFVSISLNPAHDITRAIACVYKQGIRRTVKRASQAKNDALKSINRESGMDTLQQELNRIAWFVGPTLEIPLVRNGKLCRELYTPDEYDIAVDPADPFGDPIAASYSMWIGGERFVVTVDRQQFLIWDGRGEVVGGREHGITNADGMPAFPGTIWRFDRPASVERWWSTRRHQRLVDATLDVSFIYSILSWVRKTQNRNIISFFGKVSKLQKGQLLDPEIPWILDVAEEDPIPEFKVQSNQVDPAPFFKHIGEIIGAQVEAYGIPASGVGFNYAAEGQTALQLTLTHEKKAQVRNEQIPFARLSEHSSQWRAVAAVRASSDHPLRNKVPTVDEMRTRLSIEFPELNRVDDPIKLQQLNDWRLSRGQTTLGKIYNNTHPDLSEAESDAAVLSNIRKQGLFHDEMAKRQNSPGAPIESDSQASGRVGGQARPSEDNDDERRTSERPGT